MKRTTSVKQAGQQDTYDDTREYDHRMDGPASGIGGKLRDQLQINPGVVGGGGGGSQRLSKSVDRDKGPVDRLRSRSRDRRHLNGQPHGSSSNRDRDRDRSPSGPANGFGRRGSRDQNATSSDSSDAIFQIGCTSPTAWICDLGPMFGPEGFFSPKKSINNNPQGSNPRGDYYIDEEDPGIGRDRPSSQKNKQQQQQQEPSSSRDYFGRYKALTELTEESSDEEMAHYKRRSTAWAEDSKMRQRNISPESSVSSISIRTDNMSHTEDSMMKRRERDLGGKQAVSSHTISATAEPRIVAPNVEKLSPSSQVEVYLQSPTDCVIVLCSTDVLKMRSEFFCEVLSEQDRAKHINSSIGMVRDPIILQESFPFDAAALLEALHESRSTLKGEWSYSWARLSIQWLIEDFIIEYCLQIENHFYNVINVIQTNHWRTNPHILAGWKVAIFRKSTAIHPSFMTGVVVEPIASTGHSRIRVAFDATSASTGPGAGAGNLSNSSNNAVSTPKGHSQQAIATPVSHFSSLHVATSNHSISLDDIGVQNISTHPSASATGQVNNVANPTCGMKDLTQPFVGDIAEPFWVLNTKKESSYWADPDEVFMIDSKRIIKPSDKRVFWEMVRSLIELPRLNLSCKVGFKSLKDLTSLIKRPEFKILWTADASEYLPKEVNADLVTFSFSVPPTGYGQQQNL